MWKIKIIYIKGKYSWWVKRQNQLFVVFLLPIVILCTCNPTTNFAATLLYIHDFTVINS